MHLRERFFKGVTELGPMTDRHHYNIPAILRGSHNRSSYYNTMCPRKCSKRFWIPFPNDYYSCFPASCNRCKLNNCKMDSPPGAS
jgi:hypothetical protein